MPQPHARESVITILVPLSPEHLVFLAAELRDAAKIAALAGLEEKAGKLADLAQHVVSRALVLGPAVLTT